MAFEPPNDPTVWPPMQEAFETEAVKPAAPKAGVVSLVLACSVGAVPFIDEGLWFSGIPHVGRFLAYSLMAVLVASIGGIIFGIAGRRSYAGRLGLGMSTLLFIISGAWLSLLWAMRDMLRW